MARKLGLHEIIRKMKTSSKNILRAAKTYALFQIILGFTRSSVLLLLSVHKGNAILADNFKQMID